MSLIIASVHGDVPEQVEGADLLEIRVDAMDSSQCIEKLPAMLSASPVPTIITCRSAQEGGSFDGEEQERIEIYQAAIECDNPPRYIDIEYEILTRHPLLLDALTSEHTGIILSWHDITGRPRNLQQQAAAMQDISGIDIVKMVWRARSLRDNFEAFELLQSRQQPMIAMCVGEYGLMSRVLAPKFGGFAVFASVEGCQHTAQGQPTSKDLHSLYRFDNINAETKVYGVVGNNVEHSQSPEFHNAAFQEEGKNAVFLPFPIPSGWEHLKATMLEMCDMPTLDFSGASVTIPHKEHMLKLADNVDDDSVTSGATNTITMRSGEMFANNTDITAMSELVKDPKRVLILGAGGAARAAITAMSKKGATVFVLARNKKQAQLLSEQLACEVADGQCADIDTVINCTPVGMDGGNDPEGDPLELLAPSFKLTPQLCVFDTVYKPLKTPLVNRALSKGCKVIYGNELFTLQAAEQQKIWSHT